MKTRYKLPLVSAAAVLALVALMPAIGQDRPESILPPGFGDAPPEPPKSGDGDSKPTKPAGGDDKPASPAASSSGEPATSSSGSSGSGGSKRPSSGGSSDGTSTASTEDGKKAEAKPVCDPEKEEECPLPPILVDIPPQARRSTEIVGVLDSSSGDMGLDAFKTINGAYLTKIMRHTRTPLASRWGAIVLRRALLSRAKTPGDVNGADWAAERAWLLLRMGESDNARRLVQGVDVDQYTPKMFDVAMQSALANADPAGLCAMTEHIDVSNKSNAWTLSRAICSALGGEPGLAGAQLDRARNRRAAEIDVLLAEKVVGATRNTRRAVVVEWDDVKQLNTWRYGLAVSTGMAIPERLMETVGPQARAWQATAPLLSVETRLASAEQAAAMGVFSHTALVDFYGAVYDALDASARTASPANGLRKAYIGPSAADRLASMKSLWTLDTKGPYQAYARRIATARVAATIPASDEFAADAGGVVASLLSAGFDTVAARWADVAEDGDAIEAWGLLAVGAPKPPKGISQGQISSFGQTSSNAAELKAQLLFAGLAGLGRIPADDVADMADDMGVPLARSTSWTVALQKAARTQAPAAVAIIAAAGLQAKRWNDIPPANLYHIVKALRDVGLEAEARMIAAEAVSRIG